MISVLSLPVSYPREFGAALYFAPFGGPICATFGWLIFWFACEQMSRAKTTDEADEATLTDDVSEPEELDETEELDEADEPEALSEPEFEEPDEPEEEGAAPGELTETKRASASITIIDCPVCRKPVRTRRLARHQRSLKCQMAAAMALQAQDAAAEEAKTRAQKKKLQAPRRTFLDVPMVSPKGALTTGLLDFLLNTANTAASTANDAVSCLRKIAGVKYPVTAELTAPQLYALLVDTDTLQAFFKVLEGSGMKACSRKRYVDAIRLGLTWLETRSPQEPGTPSGPYGLYVR